MGQVVHSAYLSTRPERGLGQLPPPPTGSQLSNFFSSFFNKLFGGDPTKEHDAGAQHVWLTQWAEPMAAKVRAGSLTRAQACTLVDEGDRYAQWLLSQYQRTQSATNILHTQVWPYWRAQLASICAGQAPSEWPAGVPIPSDGGLFSPGGGIFNGGDGLSSLLPWALGAVGVILALRS